MLFYTNANAAVVLYFVVIKQTHPFAVQIRDVSDVACVPYRNLHSAANESLGPCSLQ
jgi:hypothetical protein